MNHGRSRLLLMVCVTWLLALTWLPAASPAPDRAPKATFTDTIAPILYANCVTCHRPGEAAPFSLITYADVKRRAKTMAKVTQSRFMPPWQATHGHGEFADERRLSEEDIAAIGTWVQQGMPEGDRAKMPALPTFTDGWRLGTPDLVLEMPAEFEVPTSGPDIYRNFAIPTGLTEEKWIRAVEFRPRARKAVHHALFAYARGGALQAIEGKDGRPGYPGLVPVPWGAQFGPTGEVGGWAVGTTPRFLPEGLAFPLPKGSDFVVQLHLHPTGKPEFERARVGIYFADRAPERRIWNMSTPGFFGLLADLDIPPGEKHYTLTGTLKLGFDMRAFAVAAHAHYLGKDIKATATLPDGTTRPLLWIQDWDFNWQDQYFYKEPLLLPKGTTIDVAITYDNSADNPRNPNNPPKRVQWGEESFDEMGGVRFLMTATRQEDEEAMQKMIGAVIKSALQSAAKEGGPLEKYRAYRERKKAEAEAAAATAAVGASAGAAAGAKGTTRPPK